MDTLFEVCSIKQKSLIASSLCPRESLLNSNSFGKFIAIKFGLKLFKRDEKEWVRVMGEGNKRKSAVDELINEFGLDMEVSTEKVKKRKKSKSSESSSSIKKEDDEEGE